MGDFAKAIILGLVEGLTEFLPISSTGHLILAGEALSFTGEMAKVFEVVIQVGAILSVLLLYRERFLGLLKGGFNKNAVDIPGISGLSGIIKLILVSLPALVAGALFHKKIKEHLFFPVPVAIALIVGAIVMLIVELKRKTEIGKDVQDITWKMAVGIGIFQCFALWPGMSRAMSTMIGGMLLGLNRKAAAEFSFFAAVPILTLAAAKDLLDSWQNITTHDLQLMLVGLIVSFVTASLVIIWFMRFLQTWTLKPFAWYRIVLGAAIIYLYSM